MSDNEESIEWDEEYGMEFVKFTPTTMCDVVDPTPNLFVIYIQPEWKTLRTYMNQWGKTRRKIRVKIIERCEGTPYDSDSIKSADNLWLDMGARLYKCLLPFAKNNTKYVKILKSTNPLDKFDTWYTGSSYKLVVQKRIAPKKTGK